MTINGTKTAEGKIHEIKDDLSGELTTKKAVRAAMSASIIRCKWNNNQ
ncbi:MAG: hypothetical protein U5M51_12535 [Emticicia sp.]|nr:hypothetical protein [Emticicia sp.]